MFKYMKYEIKGTYKFIVGILGLVLILVTGLYLKIGNMDASSSGGNIFIGLSIMILFGTALATFLYIVGSFRKELYEDRGYLTFTLPLTGNQIVGSKLIVALLWFFIIGMVIGIYNIFMAVNFSPIELNIAELFSALLQQISIKEIIFIIVTTAFSGVNLLVLIYFSMALGKVTFRNKRIGGLWFVIFLVLTGILAYGQFQITELLPFHLNLNTFSIETLNMVNEQFSMNYNNSGVSMGADLGTLNPNIAGSLYSIVTTVGLFLGTGYLLEKKIDL